MNKITPNDIDLLDLLGIGEEPTTEQIEQIQKMGQMIFEIIMARVFDMLDDESAAQLERIVGNPAVHEDAIYNFLSEKIPHLDAVIEEENIKIKQRAAAFIQEVGKA